MCTIEKRVTISLTRVDVEMLRALKELCNETVTQIMRRALEHYHQEKVRDNQK